MCEAGFLVKYALFTEDGRLAAEDYLRHGSAVAETLSRAITDLARRTPAKPVRALFSGSGSTPPSNWAARTRSPSTSAAAWSCA